MALYTIGDLHLSLGSDKPMDIFGDRWQNYVEKIQRGFSAVTKNDTTVLCGDLSWGMSLEESLNDLTFIHNLPGRKILMKGNHDYWWNTAAKMQRFLTSTGCAPWRYCTTTVCIITIYRYAAPAAGFTSWTTRAHTTKKCWRER